MAVSAGQSGQRRPLYMPRSAPGRHIRCCPPYYCIGAPSKSSGASPAPLVWEIGVAVLPSRFAHAPTQGLGCSSPAPEQVCVPTSSPSNNTSPIISSRQPLKWFCADLADLADLVFALDDGSRGGDYCSVCHIDGTVHAAVRNGLYLPRSPSDVGFRACFVPADCKGTRCTKLTWTIPANSAMARTSNSAPKST